MMFQSWLGDSQEINSTIRAVRSWNMILRKPTSIQVIRGGVAQAAQTVRIEHYAVAREEAGRFESVGLQRAVFFGVVDHPDTGVLDTNIQRGDRVVLNNTEYEAIIVIRQPGSIQAIMEVRGM